MDLDGVQSLAIATGFMNLPTKVRTSSDNVAPDEQRVGYEPTDVLVRQGHRLAKLYCHATAVKSTPEALTAQEKFVEDGRPLVIIEFEESELQELPTQAQVVDLHMGGGVTLAFTWLKTPAGLIGTWFVRHVSMYMDPLRRLRLCLLRLHAEREVLDSVIRQMHRGRIPFEPQTDAGDYLESYLNRATAVIQREERFGVSQSAILDAYDAAESVNRPATLTGLADRLAGARTQVLRKVEKYERARGESRLVTASEVTIVHGDQIKVDRIDRSQVGAIGSDVEGTVSGRLGVDPGR
jgi:hypothetical protein